MRVLVADFSGMDDGGPIRGLAQFARLYQETRGVEQFNDY
jgi:hypothetical protein